MKIFNNLELIKAYLNNLKLKPLSNNPSSSEIKGGTIWFHANDNTLRYAYIKNNKPVVEIIGTRDDIAQLAVAIHNLNNSKVSKSGDIITGDLEFSDKNRGVILHDKKVDDKYRLSINNKTLELYYIKNNKSIPIKSKNDDTTKKMGTHFLPTIKKNIVVDQNTIIEEDEVVFCWDLTVKDGINLTVKGDLIDLKSYFN